MNATYFKSLAAAIALVSLCSATQAAPITGGIKFSGGMVLNGSAADATGVDSYFGIFGPGTDPIVLGGSQTGSYSSVAAGTSVEWTPFLFTDSSVSPLWSFEAGGKNYSFVATSIIVELRDNGFFNIIGDGFAYIDGYDPTAGIWSITGNGIGNSQFTFGASSSVPGVPDAGLTITLLGFSISGLAVIRRKVFQKW